LALNKSGCYTGRELIHVLLARYGKREEMKRRREKMKEFTWAEGVTGWKFEL
jgi:hypothetical protein